MPSAVPLNNAIAQNSLDFNNQNPTNKGGLFRYKINNYESVSSGTISQYTFTNADLNAISVFTGDVNINITPFAAHPGSEILFYSSNGRIKLEASGGSTLYSNIGNFTVPGKAGKLIYTDSNTWFFSSLNTNCYPTSFTDCCEQTRNIYQVGIGNNGNLNTAIKVYADLGADVAFNGLITLDIDAAQYDIINGQASAVTFGCYPASYDTAYTFYTEDVIYPGEVVPIIFYSLASGITPSNYSSLLGKPFFTDTVPSAIYDCSSSNRVAPSSSASYYGSPEQYPNYPVTFLDGYVIGYDGIPYMGIPV